MEVKASFLVREACKHCLKDPIYNPNYIGQIAVILESNDDYWQKSGYISREDMINVYVNAVLSRCFTVLYKATPEDKQIVLRGLIAVGKHFLDVKDKQ